MDVLTFLGYVIIVVVLMLVWALLFLVVWLVEKFLLKRRLFTRRVRGIVKYGSLLAILIVPAIQGYREDHPGSDFYSEEWNMFTGMPLPPSAEQLSADYGTPDIGGDYTVAVAYRLSESDYDTLRARFVTEAFRSSNSGSGEEEWSVLAGLNMKKEDFDPWVEPRSPDGSPNYHIGFHDFSRTIVFFGFSKLGHRRHA
ncbi:MAG: hypothetical protein ABI432_03925 [Flavobacteriales bacterium]